VHSTMYEDGGKTDEVVASGQPGVRSPWEMGECVCVSPNAVQVVVHESREASGSRGALNRLTRAVVVFGL